MMTISKQMIEQSHIPDQSVEPILSRYLLCEWVEH